MTAKVFCLILNYNRQHDTVSAVQSLLSSKLPKHTEIVIIDNGKENLANFFGKLVPSAIYLKSPGNIGFAAGNNLGIRYAMDRGATHILIMNPDVTVPRDFLLPLLKLDKDMVAPAHTEGKPVSPTGGGSYGLGGTIDWRTCSFPHENVTQLPSNPRRYDLLTFACVLIKKEVIESIGFMDERYFLYLEDVDYCVSAKRVGYSLYLDPSVVVTHRTSSSFDDPRDKIWLSFRSCLIFIGKWYRFPSNILPLLHTLYFYPSLYILWTLKKWKRQLFSATKENVS